MALGCCRSLSGGNAETFDLTTDTLVDVFQVITEQGLVQASEEFNNAAHGDRPTLRDFCAQRAAAATAAAKEASSEDAAADARMEAETWTFLRILFEDNASE